MNATAEHLADFWNHEVIDNPDFADLPYKFETTAEDEIVMTPAQNSHSAMQVVIYLWLRAQRPEGQAEIEWSVLTADGVKVPDVVWIGPARFSEHGSETPYTIAPELCVEVLSPSNSRAKMQTKARLYLDAGAEEVWLISPQGLLTIHTREGEPSASHLFPGTPDFFEAR